MAFIETEALYENTTMRKIQTSDGILMGYDIAPVEGYVLHNAVYDSYDGEPGSSSLSHKGYTSGSCGVTASYDFEANPSEIYAKKRDELGENETIF